MMRLPSKSKRNRREEILNSTSLPAPIGGWNTRDPEAMLSAKYASSLTNFFPTPANVTLRKGAQTYSTGLPGPVKSLMAWRGTASSKLFAAVDTAIYEVTAGGAVGASVQTITNGACQHVNFNTTGGSFLILVNGTDDLRYYNGSVWATVANFPISGGGTLNTNTIQNIAAFKRGLYFLDGSMNFYYLPIDQINGTVGKFPLGGLFTKGGKLVAVGGWTVDGGNGSDDYAVFASSEGQVAVYKGTDPSSASTWALVGVYDFARPMGKRCFVKNGGDLIYLCESGAFPMAKALQAVQLNVAIGISDTIRPSFQQAAAEVGTLRGWQGIVYPGGDMLVVNIPQVEDTTAIQYVMNLTTGAWCEFTGWDANCFEMLGSDLYAGMGNGTVAKCWQEGQGDFGQPVTATAKGAFSYLTPRARVKQLRLVRPLLRTGGRAQILAGADSDFRDGLTYSSQVSDSVPNYRFDAADALYDSATWGDLPAPKLEWLTVDCEPGYCVAIRLQVIAKDATVEWMATDVAYETGSIFG